MLCCRHFLNFENGSVFSRLQFAARNNNGQIHSNSFYPSSCSDHYYRTTCILHIIRCCSLSAFRPSVNVHTAVAVALNGSGTTNSAPTMRVLHVKIGVHFHLSVPERHGSSRKCTPPPCCVRSFASANRFFCSAHKLLSVQSCVERTRTSCDICSYNFTNKD